MADILVLIGAAVLILMGLVIAYRGLKILESFVRTAGALILGIVLMIVGGTVGLLFGPLVALIGALVGGVLGLILGALLAPTLLWLMLTIVVFIVCFNIGASTADSLGASNVLVWVIAILVGLIGSWIFSFLARRVLAGATSLVGGLLAGAGTFMILLEYTSFEISAGIGAAVLVLVFLTGYGANRKSGRRHKKRDRE